jgi:hypothetical protein
MYTSGVFSDTKGINIMGYPGPFQRFILGGGGE